MRGIGGTSGNPERWASFDAESTALRVKELLQAFVPHRDFLPAVLAWLKPIAANLRRRLAAAKQAIAAAGSPDRMIVEARLFTGLRRALDALSRQDALLAVQSCQLDRRLPAVKRQRLREKIR